MDFEELMYKFRMATNMTNKEIISIIGNLTISYENAYYFYLTYARFPNQKECEIINLVGINSLTNLIQNIKL